MRRSNAAVKPQQNYFGQKRRQPKVPNVKPKNMSDYALDKARRLTIEQFEAAGLVNHAKEYANSTFITNPLIAFASYIDRME